MCNCVFGNCTAFVSPSAVAEMTSKCKASKFAKQLYNNSAGGKIVAKVFTTVQTSGVLVAFLTPDWQMLDILAGTCKVCVYKCKLVR